MCHPAAMMASSVPGELSLFRMQATVRDMQSEQDWAPRRVREIARPEGARKRRSNFDDVAVAVWVVAIIGIVLLAGAVMVLAVISATVPISPQTTGPAFDGGAVTGTDQDGAVLIEDDWIYGPKLTR